MLHNKTDNFSAGRFAGSLFGPVCQGLVAFLLSLGGVLLLGSEGTRLWGACLLMLAGLGSVITWGRQQWVTPFVSNKIENVIQSKGRRLFYSGGLTFAMSLALMSGLRYLSRPTDVFG